MRDTPDMRLRLAFAVLLALAACSGTGGWTKRGVPPDRVAADYADCRHTAQSALSRDSNIDTDILASRGADWARVGSLENAQDADARRVAPRSDAIIEGCMLDKGYTRTR